MMEIGEDASNVVNAEPLSVDQEPIDCEELERELAATEEDIQTLKEALSVKIRRCVEIKKKLGHTDISTISYDVREGLTKIGESETMQKTQRALLQARSKTIDVAEDVKVKLASSIETLKNTETFKNISETMGSAFDSFKSFASPSLMWPDSSSGPAFRGSSFPPASAASAADKTSNFKSPSFLYLEAIVKSTYGTLPEPGD